MKTKKFPLLITLLGVLGVSLLTLLPKSNYRTATIEKGKVKIFALIADSPQKRVLGLGGRNLLGANQGMLFYFDQLGYPSIWMKGMEFPIDIIWMKQGLIVDIAANVASPKSTRDNLPTYTPSAPADQVLEVNSGFAAKNDLKIGVKLTIKEI